MRILEVSTFVPIFHTFFILNVSDDVVAERRKHPEFGFYLLGGDPAGLASTEENEFGLFLNIERLTPGLIAHEVFHVTHRMMNWVGGKFDLDNHEQHAYLNEWLTNWIYLQLEEKGIIKCWK